MSELPSPVLPRPSLRRVAEMLLILALAEIVVACALRWWVPALGGSADTIANLAALIVIGAPALYWRGLRHARPVPASSKVPGLASDSAELDARLRRRALALTALAYGVGLAVTALLMAGIKAGLDDDAQEQFRRHVERLDTEVSRRFERSVHALIGTRGLLAAAPETTRERFRLFFESRAMAHGHASASIGYAQRVRREDLDSFVANERADAAPDFHVRSSGVTPELYVVRLIEPTASYGKAQGFDLGSEPVRREAVERAIDSGQATLTGKVMLGQALGPDAPKSPGFLMLLPVFRDGRSPDTAEHRHAQLIGLAYTPLYAAETLRGANSVTDNTLDFQLFDGPSPTAEQRVYSSSDDIGSASAPARFEELLTLRIGGRPLTLQVRSTPRFDSTIDRRALAWAGFAGALLSALLALTVWSLAAGRVRAQALAAHMTADLDRLAKVVRHTSNAVSIADREMRITWINESFSRISGFSLAEARGKTHSELLSSGKTDPAVIAELVDAATSGRPCRAEVLNHARNGSEYWMEIDVQPLFDAEGALTGFMEIGTEVTERVRNRRELARERERLDNILNGTDAGTWEWNVMTDETIVNERYAGMLGYRLGEFGPVNRALWASLVHPDDLGGAADALTRHVSGQCDLYECEVRMRHRDGRWLWVHTRARIASRGPDGEVEWISGTHIDVTTRREAEEAVRRSDAQLRAANIDLTEARDRAEQASRAKSQFLANMSHEIRTPMNAILGMLKLLQRTPLAERQRDYASKTEHAARALLALLNDILDFSKIEAGKMSLDPRPFALAGLMQDLQTLLLANLGGKPLALRFDIDPAAPAWLRGDDLRLRQVLLNLAGNAIKFTPAGEVLLQLRMLPAADGQHRIRFEVRDTGIGIAPEQQQQIFSAFSQAEASTTRRFGGSGLGLSISRRLVGLMGGEIQLQSEPGRGSRFSFTLAFDALDDATIATAATPSADGQPRLAGLHLLLVEDNLNNQQVARELLNDEGARVTLADNGALGVAAVEQALRRGERFDAVLLDLQMPVLDGYGAASEIRQRLGLDAATLPIIAMTANAMASDRDACLAAGMNDHVGKPFELDDLVATLRQHTGRPALPLAAASSLATAPAGTAPLAAESAHPDIALASAVRRMGGRLDVWRRSARRFADELMLRGDEFEALLAAGRHEDAARLMHTLKGLAATLGAERLAAGAAAAERQARQLNPPGQAANAAPALRALLAETRQAFDMVLASPPDAQVPPPPEQGSGRPIAAVTASAGAITVPASATALHRSQDAIAVAARLRPLGALLREGDMAATELFAALMEAHEITWKQALKPLADAMTILDFPAAVLHCETLEKSLAGPDADSLAAASSAPPLFPVHPTARSGDEP